jgi:hypothetical protein
MFFFKTLEHKGQYIQGHFLRMATFFKKLFFKLLSTKGRQYIRGHFLRMATFKKNFYLIFFFKL